MSEQKRSELLREYFGNAMQLAYISEALTDWAQTQSALARCERQLQSAKAMRRKIRREKESRLHAGVPEVCCG